MGRLKVILACVAAAGAIWYFFHTGGGSDKAANGHGKNAGPVPVSAVAAKTGDIKVYLSGLGNVTPRNTVTVHTRVDGQLMRILFKEGQFVKEGDMLAELDARPFIAQLEQAQGQMMRDMALLSQARLDLQRYETLLSQDSIAKQQVDIQRSLVKQYEGAVGNDKGQIDNAKLQITYTKITAPFSGQVGLRQVDPGNIVHTGDANGIAVVTQLQPITAIFTLSEDAIPRIMKHIQAGDKIIAEAWDRDNKTELSTGEVVAVDNQVDQSTGTIKLRSEFSNEDNALFPSQFVNIRCLLETRKDVLLVPVSAIQHGSEGTFVYLVKPENTVTVRPVKTDIAEGDTISIADGLKAGDVVVTDGSDNLREGAKIDVPPPVPQPSASAVSMTPVPPPEGDSHKHRHKKDTE